MATVSVVAEGEPGRWSVSTDEDPWGACQEPALIFMLCVTLTFPAMGASGFLCLFQKSVETMEVDGGLSWNEPSTYVLCLSG